MVPGIWLEIEVMGVDCPILDQFEDECFFMRHGKRVIDHGRYQLDFRNQKVRDFAESVVDRLVTEYGAGYIKMDYNIDGGTGTEIQSDSFGDGLLQHNRAYLSWLEKIMDKYPDLIIENCSSGGMRIDYGMLSRYSIQSVTDQEDYKKMAYIAQAAATAALPEQAAIWAYPTSTDDKLAVAFNMVNAMPFRMHLSGEITRLSDECFEMVREGVQCYKEIRDNIKSSIPFYPDGLGAYGNEWLCTGYRGAKDTYIAVWRMDSETDTFTLPGEAELVYPKNCGFEVKKNKIIMPKQYSAAILRLKK